MDRQQGVRYHGVRTRGDARVWREEGKAMTPLPVRLEVRNHSPDGFEWGYGGSGPAQLALAILCDALEGDTARAERLYQAFKWRIVAAIGLDVWVLERDAVLATVALLERVDPPDWHMSPALEALADMEARLRRERGQ